MRPLRLLFALAVFGLLALGYVRERERARSDPRDLLAVPREGAPRLERLRPPVGELVLRGQVRDAAGAPAAGVEVFLFPAVAEPGTAEPLHATFTDADGRFELAELEAQGYGVVLSLASTPPRTLEVTLPSDEVLWTLPPPLEPLEVLPHMRRADLAGRIRSAAGVDLAAPALDGYEVVLRPAPAAHPLSGAVVLRARTDADGHFAFEQAVAEDYALELLPPWAAGGSWPVLDRVELTHDPDGSARPVLRVRSGSVEASVVDPAGRAVEGALVKVWPDEHPGRIWPPATSGPDGSFVVSDLPPGAYRLRVHAGAALHEAAFEVREGLRERLALPPLETSRPVAESTGPADRPGD